MVDLEAENAVLRAALAKSEGSEERHTLVTDELKHRIGNLLAVVHAIARHTFNAADAAKVDDFSARLHALAAAQKLLIDADTSPATVAHVVASSLEPHCAQGDRARMSGPEVFLDGRRAHALTLALHELATNASKYGALSAESGWIEIAWTSGDGFGLLWREHNGPPVTAPSRRGFGTSLITRNLASAFGGEVDLDFDAAGLVCRLRAPAT
jgi:two-component sensor histidine kinase